jgi:hypothetical protein
MLVVAAEVSSAGLWSVMTSSSTDEVDRRAAAWGLPICLLKVADLGFLLWEDGDLSDAGPS